MSDVSKVQKLRLLYVGQFTDPQTVKDQKILRQYITNFCKPELRPYIILWLGGYTFREMTTYFRESPTTCRSKFYRAIRPLNGKLSFTWDEPKDRRRKNGKT